MNSHLSSSDGDGVAQRSLLSPDEVIELHQEQEQEQEQQQQQQQQQSPSIPSQSPSLEARTSSTLSISLVDPQFHTQSSVESTSSLSSTPRGKLKFLKLKFAHDLTVALKESLHVSCSRLRL